MLKWGWIGILIWMMTTLTSCAGFNVRSDWDSDRELGSLHQYAWVEPPPIEHADPFADNSLLRKRVRRAVEDGLADRGFRRVPVGESPDFLVTWVLTLDERLRVNDGRGAAIGGRYRYGFGGFYSSPAVRSYQESTLVIDFLSPDDQALMWRGWGTDVVGTRDRQRSEARLARGVKAILAAFPPAGVSLKR